MNSRIKAILIFAFIILVFFLYTKEIFYFSATFGAQTLFVKALGIGFFIGLTWGLINARNEKDMIAKIQNIAIFSLFFAFVAPLVASISNRLLSNKTATDTEVLVQKIEPYATSRTGLISNAIPKPEGFFIYFDYNQRAERLKMPISCFPMLNDVKILPTPMNFQIKKGFWGFDFVLKNC